MDDSYTIIRRFTPPTCTLEIWGKNSPLSRWTKTTIVKNLQFKLSFDDPRNLDTEPIIVTGDRTKLDKLYNLVLEYTENFLEQSFLTKSLSSIATNHNQTVDSTEANLSSQELVNHQFNFGNFTTNTNHSTIELSATQLLDLVSALEDYQIEMSAIADLQIQQTNKSRKIITIGMSVAGLLLAVGLTTVGIKVANQSKKPEQIASSKESESPVKTIKPQEDVIPPEAPKAAKKPAVDVKKNDPLASTEKLPPPPAVDAPKPPPDIPDPAKYPPSGNLTIPPLSSLPKQPTNSELTTPTPEAKSQPDNSQVESTITVPNEPTAPTPSEETIKPEAAEKTTELEIASESEKPITKLPTFTENNNSQSLETIEEAEINISSENTAIDTEIQSESARASRFSEDVVGDEPTENGLDDSDRVSNNLTINERDIALDNTRSKPTTDESTVIENQAESKIPQDRQLEEVASYFRQKWQSPSELKQTLEYRLILDRDGSIKRIIPIGKASEIYLDRTNIPLMGEPFVSPLQNKDSVTIRLLLSPDSEVRTFLE